MRPQTDAGFTLVASHDTTRPGTGWGATITPGNNTYGSYATVLGTPLAADAYAIEILVHGINVSATVTDSLTTIGIDPAGGTSYSDFIPHLLTTAAGIMTTTTTMGIKYWFPIRIPAGATIGAKGSINNATVGTQLVGVKLWCRPSAPRGFKYGTYITTFGENTAASSGTAVTAGGASEGTYTQLGSAIAAGKPIFHFIVAGSINNSSTWNSTAAHIDLAHGDATTKKTVILDQAWGGSNTEYSHASYRGEYTEAAPGDLVYARVQSSSASTGFACIAYGVGA